MTRSPEISVEVLRKLLRHDPVTGQLFWKTRPIELFRDTENRTAEHTCALWNSIWAGQEAFTSVQEGGYRRGGVFGRLYLAHRVIWALETGEWPVGEIDHRDGDTGQNAFSNLRDTDHSKNMKNTKSRTGSSSAYLGVSASKNRWKAQIQCDGKKQHIGSFKTQVEAAKAYDEQAIVYFGAFANLNFPAAAGVAQ